VQHYKTSGAELIMGAGHFVAPKTLEVRLHDGGPRLLAGDQVFLNVGTHAAIPSIPGLKAARPLTHIEALELDYLPPHLLVLGGGYVGLELAQAYRRFGSRVTVIQHGPQLMGREDPDVAAEVQRLLSDEGIHVLVAAETLQVHGRSGGEVHLVVRTPSGEHHIEGSDILVTAGRMPNTAGIGQGPRPVPMTSPHHTSPAGTPGGVAAPGMATCGVRLVHHDPLASQADAPRHTPGETCAAQQRPDRRETPSVRTRTGLLPVDSSTDFLTF
jgi:pyruvate/2-oxoglutarate dehydrogenase complex dihydrolipoamide dehydrogenase (E3) component